MSILTVENEIINFLSEKNWKGDVTVLKGRWGTGKTYFWNEIIEKVKIESYAYVSLFGMESLDNLKSEIFFQTNKQTTDNKTNKVTSFFNKNKNDAMKYADKLTFEIPFVTNITIPFGEIGWSKLCNSVICFDDLERKSKNLDIKDFLGIISVLKEQKNCKVILIVNDGAIADQEILKIYGENKEKIVDRELLFDPQISDLIDIVFKNDVPDNYMNLLKRHIIELDLKNIRTLIKIKNYFLNIIDKCKNLQPEVAELAIEAIVRLSAKNWEKKSIQEKSSLLSISDGLSYNLDNIIEPLIINGWVDNEACLKQLQVISNKVEENKKEDITQEKWKNLIKLIHESLLNNQDEITKSAKAFFSGENGSTEQLNLIIGILKEIGKHEYIPVIVKAHIDRNAGKLELDTLISMGITPSSELIEEEKNIKAKQIEDRLKGINLSDELDKIISDIDGKILSKDAIVIIASAKRDDIAHYLLRRRIDANTKAFLKQCISSQYYIHEDMNELYQNIGNKIRDVINSLQSNSLLNRYRFSKWNLS